MITCGDCGKKKGAVHGESCDIERCPKCSSQLFSCDCNFPKITVDGKYFIDENDKKYKRSVVQTECDM